MPICTNPVCGKPYKVQFNQEGFKGCDHYCSWDCCQEHYAMSGVEPTPENLPCPCY